jgi:GntR family transcriptional regulator, vanillate catabolism transcriptional regulator
MPALDTKSDEAFQVEPASDRLVDDLRQDILNGRYAPDSRLIEESISRERGVSRTPVRHALRALEQEGLLHRLPRRGYRVRSYTIDEVADAIEVRGELEAIAARIHAERGWSADARAAVAQIVIEGKTIISKRRIDDEAQLRWAELNLAFHDALVLGTGNIGLVVAYEQLKRIPLVSPRAVVFERSAADVSHRQISAAQADHDRVIRAIDERKGQRAAEIMRDHAIRSGENKRQNFHGVLANEFIVADLGAALVKM